jgi:hypothetical protein
MKTIEEIFGRVDFDGNWPQDIGDVTRECESKFGEPVAGYTQVLSSTSPQPMSIWFVVADQLVRMQHGKSGGTKWPINSLRGSMSSTSDTKTLNISHAGGSMAFAIMALNKRNVTYLDRFLRFLVAQGLDIAANEVA